jgi:hypothetical protein
VKCINESPRRLGHVFAGFLTARSRPSAAAGRERPRFRRKPELLPLEDRQLLSTFTVENTSDTVISGVPASGTLRWAIEQADQAGGTDSIDFDPSVFGTAQTITLGQLLTPIEISTAITINGPGAGLLTINGNNDGGVFEVESGVSATITNVTITGASLGNNGAIDDLGSLSLSTCTITDNTISGVYVAGTADISDCTITGNNSYSGAGVYVKGGTATITDSTLSDNTGAQGGGVCDEGTATLTDCTLSGDSTLGGGGALYNSGQLKVYSSTLSGDDGSGAAVFNHSGTAYLSGTTISGGSGFIDGGNLDNQYGATLNVTDCTISGATAQIGAGLYNAGKATLTDCTISNNNATFGYGGGISNGHLQNKAVLIVNDCTISGNTCKENGGGLGNWGTATLTDCTITANFANQDGSLLSSNGGGVDNDGTVTLVACTVSGNSTTALGGGLYNGGLGVNKATLDDTIIAGNTLSSSGSANDISVGNSSDDVNCSYDLIGTVGSGVVGGGSGDISVSSLSAAGLSALGNYGGPTETIALLPGSPALHAGSQALELNPQGQALTTDQRGEPLDTPTPDIGAFQSQGFTLKAATGSTPQSAATGAAFTNDLSVTLTANNSEEPVSGGVVTFTVDPASNGAAATLSTSTVTVGSGGSAEVKATANSISGSYDVTASVAGDATSVTFSLTNLVGLSFSVSSTQTISYGSASVAIGGTLANGTQAPVGEDVAVTFNGTTQQAPVGAGGVFSTTFTNTAALTVADSPYKIKYAYTSDGTFTAATATSELTVTKATPTITWANPADITHGTALSATQLDATTPVAGTFTYTPAAGTVLAAGQDQSLSLVFTPTDSADYNTASDTVEINVDPITPTITWANPADITYGTALSATQLDATASVPGTFDYTPALGTVLHAGTDQTLTVLFLPTDSTDYSTVSGTATINVDPVTPTITWANPADITYGTALSATQLDATASVPGTFTYTPDAGTVLTAGTDQTLSVAFTPSDATDYTTASDTAAVNVDPATPTIAWPNPADIIYGTALSATQLDAAASSTVGGTKGSVAGTFTYTPDAGTVLTAGTGQTLSVTFTPTDTTDYTTASSTTTIDVDKVAPTITWADPAAITYGTALSAIHLDATTPVLGTFSYTPAAGTVLSAGTGQTLSVTFTPTNSTDYTTSSLTVTIDVDKVTPTITWADPAAITYGAALSATQLDATASVPGTFTYTPALGTFLNGGAGQTLSVTFRPEDATDYTTAAATTTIDVDPATPTLDLSDPGGRFDGNPFPASVSIAGSGSQNTPAASLQNITPTLTYYNGAGTSLGSTPPTTPGTYTVVAVFPGNANYASVQTTAVPFTIAQGNATIALSSSSSSAVYGQSVTFVATVASTAAGTPTGTVTFSDDGTPLGAVTISGSGTATLTTSSLPLGSQSITATYSGDADFLGGQSGATSVPVAQARTQVVLMPQPVFKKKKVVSLTLTAEIEPVAPGGGIPTGAVTFELVKQTKKKSKVTTLGTVMLSSGDATLSVKPNKVLKKPITISYNGDTDYMSLKETLPAPTQSELKSLARPMIALAARGRPRLDVARTAAVRRG